MTVHVLHAIAGASQGGAEAFFERLAIALHEVGLSQVVVMRPDAARQARLVGAGLTTRLARFGGVLDVVTPWRLRAAIREHRPRVVLSWMSRASAAVPSRGFAGDRGARVGRLGGYYDLKYYRGCDHLLANTPDIVDYITRAGWPADRVDYAPNFADEKPVAAIDRAALGATADDVIALALGRFHPNKAFDTLLDAMAKAPALKLWLAGEGELRGALEAQTARLGLGGRVKFLGWRDDAAALMAAADLVICPSRCEPLGNVVIEAWARRRAVIATASAGPAALIQSGSNGLLVPVDDADALAAAMTRLAGDRELRWGFGEVGYASYCEKFSRHVVVDTYLRLFQRIADRCAA